MRSPKFELFMVARIKMAQSPDYKSKLVYLCVRNSPYFPHRAGRRKQHLHAVFGR